MDIKSRIEEIISNDIEIGETENRLDYVVHNTFELAEKIVKLFAIPVVKPSFYLQPIAGGISGCLNCGYTEEKLPMRTSLYSGFGGWDITKDGKHYFNEDSDKEYDEAKTLSYIERRAKLEPECDWRANLNLPLRSAVYQRQGKSKWVLVKRGQGFA